MKRVVTGFFLSLVILLSGGYTQLYAQSLTATPCFFTTSQIVKHSLPGKDQLSHASESTAIEEEDDDNTSSRKLIEASAFITPIYYNQHSVQRSPICESFINLSHSNSYILYRVFRIWFLIRPAAIPPRPVIPSFTLGLSKISFQKIVSFLRTHLLCGKY